MKSILEEYLARQQVQSPGEGRRQQIFINLGMNCEVNFRGQRLRSGK